MRRLVRWLHMRAAVVQQHTMGNGPFTRQDRQHMAYLMGVLWALGMIASHLLVYAPLTHLLSSYVNPVPTYAVALNAAFGVTGSVATIAVHRLAYMSGYCSWCREW